MKIFGLPLGTLNFRWKVAIVLSVVFLLLIGSFASFAHSIITQHDTEGLRTYLLQLTNLGVETLDIPAYKKIISRVHGKRLTLQEKEAITLLPEHQKIQKELDAIHRIDPELIGSVYIIIPTKDPKEAQFVVDMETTPEQIQQNRNREDFETWVVFPGNYYDISDQPTTMKALAEEKNMVDTEIRFDSTWNEHSLMGYAPIFDPVTHEYLGVLGIDLFNADINKKNAPIHLALNIATAIIVLLGLVVIFIFTKNILHVKRLTEANEALEKSYAQLRELDDKKSEFLNIASHELRTPMTSIRGYASMLLDGDAGVLPEPAIEYIRVMLNQSKRLVRLINDMLDISKMESGRDDKFVLMPVRITKFFREIHNDFIPIAKEKKLDLEWFIFVDEELEVLLPSDRFRQAIMNLLGNAIKFTPALGKIVLAVRPGKKELIITVTDTGIGINKAYYALIFEKFGQARSSLNKNTEGTGLGLPISKAIIEKMGGTIKLTSVEGKGTTFTVRIPIQEVSGA